MNGEGTRSQGVFRLLLIAFIPPVISIVAWPLLYFALFLAGLGIALGVSFACLVIAAVQNEWLARQFVSIFPRASLSRLRLCLGVLQVVGILASYPLWIILLNVLESAGFKVGWS